MNFVEFTAASDDSGRRLDRIAKKIISQKNMGFNGSLFALFRKGFIKLNGKKTEGNVRVEQGDVISFADFIFSLGTDTSSLGTDPSSGKKLSEKEEIGGFTRIHGKNLQAEKEESGGFTRIQVNLETVFRNEYLWIINKPYGISVQPSSAEKISLSDIVLEEYETSAKEKSLSFRPGPLHRLDRNTTGLLVFSQNLEGAQWFSKAIGTKDSVFKTYIGIVKGKLEKEYIWEDLIENKHKSIQSDNFYKVNVTEKSSKFADMAVTKAFPLAYGKYLEQDITLVQFDILTGRKHQIRASSSYHGFPLLGDSAYGCEKIKSSFTKQEFFLHAIRLIFSDGRKYGLPDEIIAPLPHEFKKFLSSSLINWNGRLIINI